MAESYTFDHLISEKPQTLSLFKVEKRSQFQNSFYNNVTNFIESLSHQKRHLKLTYIYSH